MERLEEIARRLQHIRSRLVELERFLFEAAHRLFEAGIELPHFFVPLGTWSSLVLLLPSLISFVCVVQRSQLSSISLTRLIS
jgi:hypothetical protein